MRSGVGICALLARTAPGPGVFGRAIVRPGRRAAIFWRTSARAASIWCAPTGDREGWYRSRAGEHSRNAQHFSAPESRDAPQKPQRVLRHYGWSADYTRSSEARGSGGVRSRPPDRTTTVVNCASGATGAKGNADSTEPSVSGVGRFVALSASNLHAAAATPTAWVTLNGAGVTYSIAASGATASSAATVTTHRDPMPARATTAFASARGASTGGCLSTSR